MQMKSSSSFRSPPPAVQSYFFMNQTYFSFQYAVEKTWILELGSVISYAILCQELIPSSIKYLRSLVGILMFHFETKPAKNEHSFGGHTLTLLSGHSLLMIFSRAA